MNHEALLAGFICFMVAALFGALAVECNDAKWRCWAVENNYAHYSPDTGEFVLQPWHKAGGQE